MGGRVREVRAKDELDRAVGIGDGGAFVDAFSHRTGGAILATRQGFSVAQLPSNISTGT